MRWIFGLNRRCDIPVIFLPAPPFLLAIPLRQMDLPIEGFLPQILHILLMISNQVYWKIGFCQEKIERSLKTPRNWSETSDYIDYL